MKGRTRRHWLATALAGGSAVVLGPLAVQAQAPREIALVAQRFKFTPDEVALRVNEVVVIAVRSLDFIHGFHVPDLGLRSDLLPGMVTRITLQPRQTGTLDFLCDNFCGDGHETMHGRFIVSE